MASSEAALILRYFGRYTAGAARRVMSEAAPAARGAFSEARTSASGTSQSTTSKTMEAGTKIRASSANSNTTSVFM